MDDELRSTAEGLISATPCSLEMPAGTGKTHLLAASAAVAAERGRRSLVLTHTNAGVEAIRKRLRDFGIRSAHFRVETIASWAFSLARAYSDIAGIPIDPVPDWRKSNDYLKAATSVARSKAITEVHEISFDYLFVDEYQDCSLVQHEFVEALTVAVPKTAILGDRLQTIFTFDGPTVSWDRHVLPRFPSHGVPVEPHRWMNHNLDLGHWLLDIRSELVTGRVFDLAAHSIPGVEYVPGTGPKALADVTHSFRNFNETVVVLDKWHETVASHASRLGGEYLVMEDLSGRFMRDQLKGLPLAGDERLAWWFANFAKACFIGLSGLDSTVLGRLATNEPIKHLVRPGIQPVVDAIEHLRQEPTYPQLAETAQTVRNTKGIRVYRREAWNDSLKSIALSEENSEPPIANLARVRDQLRRGGRRAGNRIASRTLLVKGLEFDHVVVAELSNMKDPCNLYVALSRARKTVTILGASSRVRLQVGS